MCQTSIPILKKSAFFRCWGLLIPMILMVRALRAQDYNSCVVDQGLGCQIINYENFGMNSDGDPVSLSYDNFISGYHATVVREASGGFEVWGQLHSVNSGSDENYYFTAPTPVNTTTFPGLSGTPVYVTLGSLDGGGAQLFVLTTSGLYVVGHQRAVLTPDLTNSDKRIGEISLPEGVSAINIKSLFATAHSLGLLTCSGNVYVISQEETMRGSGNQAAGNSVTWYRVRKDDGGDLTRIIALRGNAYCFFALDANGHLWTWGIRTYLGNGSSGSARYEATQMALPSGVTGNIKMIGATGYRNSTGFVAANSKVAYYVLYSNGALYAMGDNDIKQLGDWTMATRTTWIQPKYDGISGPVMNDIQWIAPQEHDMRFSQINVITKSRNLYNWGGESGYDLGRGREPNLNDVWGLDPGSPFSPEDNEWGKVIGVSTGGHTLMVNVLCQENFGYVGHKIDGSMGDGTRVDARGQNKFSYATAAIQVCGAPTRPELLINTNIEDPEKDSLFCGEVPILLKGLPAEGTFKILSTTGGSASFNEDSSQLNFSGKAGTVTIRYINGGFPCAPNFIDTTLNFGSCRLVSDIKETLYHNHDSLAGIGENTTIALPNIIYDFDQYSLKPESGKILDKVVEMLKENPQMMIRINSHTDNKGGFDYNMDLSQRRAQSVVAYLISKGIAANRLRAKGYGYTIPVAPNQNADGSDNPRGRQLNRRTDMTILSDGHIYLESKGAGEEELKPTRPPFNYKGYNFDKEDDLQSHE